MSYWRPDRELVALLQPRSGHEGLRNFLLSLLCLASPFRTWQTPNGTALHWTGKLTLSGQKILQKHTIICWTAFFKHKTCFLMFLALL